jgi:outer membrane protein insertion porin family
MNFVPIIAILVLQFGLFFSESSRAATIGHIKIEGQKKLEVDAILARIKSKEGGTYSTEQVRDDVVNLFALGYFNNIEVHKEVVGQNIDLVFRVIEKPSISEIVYEGNSEIKDEDLSEATGLKAFQIISMSKVREAQEKIQKQYEDKGYFLAKIEPRLEDVSKDETQRLIFDIKENDKIKVKKIRFIGNKKLKDDTLKDRMATKEGGFFSFMSGSGSYKQDAFERDVQMLRFTYFNEGYVQVKIDRPQVYVTPDKKGIYITIRVEEGEQYNVGDIDFAGDLLFSNDELRETIQIDENKIFAYSVLQKDLSDLTAKYGDLGYAFANVIPRTKVNETERKVDVTFEFDKGNKVYFGRISVVGNSKTRDKVVRRELKILEGELYNETRKRESLENVQRLGFFDDVSFKTSTPTENPDLLNLDVVVKERNTGQIQLGAGYSSSQGFTFYGQVNQANFLGKGQKLGASLNINDRGSYYNLNFTEPNYNDTDWSLGYDIYQSISDRYDYSQKVTGGALRVGHPLSENVSGFLRYRYDNTLFTPETNLNQEVLTDYTLFPLDSAKGVTSSVTATVEYDKRNDRFSPSKGLYLSGSIEYAGLGGDLKYFKGSSSFRYFQKLFWDVVWRNNISYAALHGMDGKPLPFNELNSLLLGGAYSLRGFQMMSVGKRVFSQKRKDYLVGLGVNSDDADKRAWRPFGGAKQLYYTAELEFPLIAEVGMKGVTFYDIGTSEDNITNENFYSDVGFGLRWFSPIGPLRFEWGFPLNRNPDYHEPMNFEFSIGTPF